MLFAPDRQQSDKNDATNLNAESEGDLTHQARTSKLLCVSFCALIVLDCLFH
jgi:hypothetical protein